MCEAMGHDKCEACGCELNSFEILYCESCLAEKETVEDNTCAGCGCELECFEVIYCYSCIVDYEHSKEKLAEIEV